MKTCAACGRPLASHGGKAATKSSEIGRKAGDAPCCEPQAKVMPGLSKSERTKPSAIRRPTSKSRGTRQQAAKKTIRALREFARKKLGRFLPARITLRPRHQAEQTASETVRPKRPAVRLFRTRKRRIKSEHVVPKPPEKVEASLPCEAASNAVEQSPQPPPAEVQLEKRLEEPEQVASRPPEQIEASFPGEEESAAVKQSPQIPLAEAHLEKRSEETGHVIATSAEQNEPSLPSQVMSDAIEQSSQIPPAEAALEGSTEESATDTTLFQTEELVFVPWRAEEPLDVAMPAPETPALEEQAITPPVQTVEVYKAEEPHTEPSTQEVTPPPEPLTMAKPAEEPTNLETLLEKVAPKADPTIRPAAAVHDERLDIALAAPTTPRHEEQAQEPPSPAAEVCRPVEPHTEQIPQCRAQSNKSSTVEKPEENPLDLQAPAKESPAEPYPNIPPTPSAPVPGRTEFAAKQHSPIPPQTKSLVVDEQAVEHIPGLTDSTSPEMITHLTNPIEAETGAGATTKTEDCLQQALAPEPESATACDQASEDEAAAANIAQPAKKKVLVVDDDPTLRMLLKMGLEPHGYECLLAENGKAAQAVVQASQPALILVDLLMPVMDGMAFVQWLRKTAQDSTPVLIFTNLDDAKITQEALDNGANAFACKPLRFKELLQTIKNLVPG